MFFSYTRALKAGDAPSPRNLSRYLRWLSALGGDRLEVELGRQRPILPSITVVLTDHDIIDQRARKIREFWDLLTESDMKVARATLPSRKVYKAMQLGGTLYTVPNADPKSIADGAALFNELFGENAMSEAAE
ncbi:hypothetical protein [Phyllobacterium chamaecytisi]|uniref:hypothetical protein n=1 Tax=Phyllobacterium chamaecytisi TaxID=2876082 RepID=UPI001CCB4D86|nr:hypothetical protein [Phyllobacterium sp. KW56]MBZ9605687.1 hypothetical protein [Phyllobacterium sp. KW56]